jgi:hypothetical protein
MSEACYNAKYLVLHFLNGELTSTKVVYSWRGAQMSKQNHEREYKLFPSDQYDAATRILPVQAILKLQGLEQPDTSLTASDADLLRRMGIDL